MPITRLRSLDVPKALNGWIVIDAVGRPRYWSTIWSDIIHASLNDSTKSRLLGPVDCLYQFVEELGDDLDVLITNLDLERIENALGGFLTLVRNESARKTIDGNQKWSSALRFVLEILEFLSLGGKAEASELAANILRLQRLYSQLSPSRPPPPVPIRALPSLVLDELYGVFNPISSVNPFKSEAVKWRNFTIFLVLLHLGIRRGELLVLTTNSLVEEMDPISGEMKHWLMVTNLIDKEDHDWDTRAQRPGIKTSQSHRQLPLSAELLSVIDKYLMNYRGTPAHRFLINSQKNFALDTTAVNKVFQVATASLSSKAIKLLNDRGRYSVTPHDLRHTAAVYRLKRHMDDTNDLRRSIDKLRVFFGWSYTSNMPRHYARAYFETEVSEVWSDQFDGFVEKIRALEGKPL